MRHSDWKSRGGGGVRDHILKKINTVYTFISQDINSSFMGLAEAHRLATLCLTTSFAAVTQLVSSVDAIYDKLHEQSKFASDAAWSLTMQILDKVCEELFAPKDNVMQSMTLGDPESVCAHVMFASFRSLDIMVGYTDHQIEEQLSVSTEYIRFLATNSGSKKVEKMAELSEKLRVDLKQSIVDCGKAAAKADTASTKVSSLTTELAAAICRIKTLEDRPRN
jgi:hypothetical protein